VQAVRAKQALACRLRCHLLHACHLWQAHNHWLSSLPLGLHFDLLSSPSSNPFPPHLQTDLATSC